MSKTKAEEPKKDETPVSEPTVGNPVGEPKKDEGGSSEKKERKIFSERFKGKKLIGKNGVEISFDENGFVEGELDESQKQRLISIGFCEVEV